MGSRFTPAPNADARRATSLQCPPKRLRLANGSSPGSAAMPDSIWRRIGLRVLARGSDYVCTLPGRLNDALLHNEAITDRALRQASVAERPVALPPVDPTKGATPWPHCFSPIHKLIRKHPPASRPTRKAFAHLGRQR